MAAARPAFRHEHLHEYVAVMRQEITTAMTTWHDGDVIDLVDEMFTLTTTIALRALFSLPRTCTRPVTLAGRTLPPGSLIVCSPYILHRRPDQYPIPPGRTVTCCRTG